MQNFFGEKEQKRDFLAKTYGWNQPPQCFYDSQKKFHSTSLDEKVLRASEGRNIYMRNGIREKYRSKEIFLLKLHNSPYIDPHSRHSCLRYKLTTMRSEINQRRPNM